MKNSLFFSICVVVVAAALVALADTETSEAMVSMPLLFTPQSKRRLPAFLRQKQKSAKAYTSISTFGKSPTSRISTMKKYSLQQIAAAKRSIHASKEAVKTGTATFLKTAWAAIVRPLTTAVITTGLLAPSMPIAPIAQTANPGEFYCSDVYIGDKDHYHRTVGYYTDGTISVRRDWDKYNQKGPNGPSTASKVIKYRFRDGTRRTYTGNYCEVYANLNGTIYRVNTYNPPSGELRRFTDYRRGMTSAHVYTHNLTGEDQDFGLVWSVIFYSRRGELLGRREYEEEKTVPPSRSVVIYSLAPYPISYFSVQSF